MRILRLTGPEETRLKKSARFLKIDQNVLLNLILKNELDYLENQEKEYLENPSPCFMVELAENMGLSD